MGYVILVAFPLQNGYTNGTLALRFAYIACFVMSITILVFWNFYGILDRHIYSAMLTRLWTHVEDTFFFLSFFLSFLVILFWCRTCENYQLWTWLLFDLHLPHEIKWNAKSHGSTIRTVHTIYAAALKTTTNPKTRCRKPHVAAQHLMLLMMGVCARNMSS